MVALVMETGSKVTSKQVCRNPDYGLLRAWEYITLGCLSAIIWRYNLHTLTEVGKVEELVSERGWAEL